LFFYLHQTTQVFNILFKAAEKQRVYKGVAQTNATLGVFANILEYRLLSHQLYA